jgi:hypothetical protein
MRPTDRAATCRQGGWSTVVRAALDVVDRSFGCARAQVCGACAVNEFGFPERLLVVFARSQLGDGATSDPGRGPPVHQHARRLTELVLTRPCACGDEIPLTERTPIATRGGLTPRPTRSPALALSSGIAPTDSAYVAYPPESVVQGALSAGFRFARTGTLRALAPLPPVEHRATALLRSPFTRRSSGIGAMVRVASAGRKRWLRPGPVVCDV